jgi:hypothetical protein
MTRQYDSFVLRCWQLGSEQRVEVEHLQSGGRTRAETLGAAFTWIKTHRGQSDERDSVVCLADDPQKEVTPNEDHTADQDIT